MLLSERDACLIIKFLGDLLLLEYIHLTISHTVAQNLRSFFCPWKHGTTLNIKTEKLSLLMHSSVMKIKGNN